MATTKSHAILKNKSDFKTIATQSPASELEFVLDYRGAKQVYVCYDFNGWHPTSLHMIGNADASLWEKRLTLPPGWHEYKVIVNGQRLHYPEARENPSNTFSTLN